MLGSKRPERASLGTWYEVWTICDEGEVAGAARVVAEAAAEGHSATSGENREGDEVAFVCINGPAPAAELERLVRACGLSATYWRS